MRGEERKEKTRFSCSLFVLYFIPCETNSGMASRLNFRMKGNTRTPPDLLLRRVCPRYRVSTLPEAVPTFAPIFYQPTFNREYVSIIASNGNVTYNT